MQQAVSSHAIPLPLPPAQQLHRQRCHATNVAMDNPDAGAGFTPVDYTRAMFGSLVWQAHSPFSVQLYPCTSPSHILGSVDSHSGQLSSSIEDDGELCTQAQDIFQCRDYKCCGTNLGDLHALVEHLEEAHTVSIDPATSHQLSPLPDQPSHVAAEYAQQHHLPCPAPALKPQMPTFDPSNDMEPDERSSLSSSASSPPRTSPHVLAISTQIPYVSAPYSTSSTPKPSTLSSPAFDTIAVPPPHAGTHQVYVNYPPFPPVMHDSRYHEDTAVAPVMLLRRYDAQQSKQELGVSEETIQAAPATLAQRTTLLTNPAPLSPGGASSESSRASLTLSRLALSLLVPKPFRCPKSKCNKSYKQANGLKYHMTHGSCSFAPSKELEAVQALLAEKGLSPGGDLSESDAREVEREVTRRLRPFACAVGKCTRRYMHMNGLRYHYQHSGEHGAQGLRLIASGQHECLQHRARKAAGDHRQTRHPHAPPGQFDARRSAPTSTAAAVVAARAVRAAVGVAQDVLVHGGLSAG